MTSYPEAMRRLDNALAVAVRLEVELKNERIKAGIAQINLEHARDEIADLKQQLKMNAELAADLMKMADSLRAERDTWRAEASR